MSTDAFALTFGIRRGSGDERPERDAVAPPPLARFELLYERLSQAVLDAAADEWGYDSADELSVSDWEGDGAINEGVSRMLRDVIADWGIIVEPEGWSLRYEVVADEYEPVGRVVVASDQGLQLNGRVSDALGIADGLLDRGGVAVIEELLTALVRQGNALLDAHRA